jgi:hypothetical protein
MRLGNVFVIFKHKSTTAQPKSVTKRKSGAA